jgi:hypothetical protein
MKTKNDSHLQTYLMEWDTMDVLKMSNKNHKYIMYLY